MQPHSNPPSTTLYIPYPKLTLFLPLPLPTLSFSFPFALLGLATLLPACLTSHSSFHTTSSPRISNPHTIF